MLHLLIIDPGDFLGGAELFNLDLIRHFNPEKIKITLVCSGREEYLKYVNTNKVKVIPLELSRLKPISFRNFWKFRKNVKNLKKIIRKANPDLVYTNSVRAHLCGSLAAKACRKKIIWYLHDYTFPKFFLRHLIKIPAKVITNSEGVGEFTKDLIPKKYHAKLVVIPNGIALDSLEKKLQEKTSLQDQFNLPSDCQLVGIVGRIDEWKGQEYFVRAAAKVLTGFFKVRFLIIGDSSAHDPKTVQYKKKIIRLIEDLNLKKEILLIGFQSDIYPVIKELSVLVHASTEKEPFGRVIVEGMAIGTPVIGSSIGGPTEIIRNGVNGILVAPTDTQEMSKHIIKLLTDAKFREKIIYNAHKTVEEKYDLKKITNRLEHLFQLVAS